MNPEGVADCDACQNGRTLLIDGMCPKHFAAANHTLDELAVARAEAGAIDDEVAA